MLTKKKLQRAGKNKGLMFNQNINWLKKYYTKQNIISAKTINMTKD